MPLLCSSSTPTSGLHAEAARVKARKDKIDAKRTKLSAEEASKIKAAGKAWYQTMISDSDYTEFLMFSPSGSALACDLLAEVVASLSSYLKIRNHESAINI
jgi:hypothetical protein